jgi:hypothetical protein
MDFQIFAQLTKIDEEKRLVYGRLAQEYPDKSGEIMDYFTSKPNFEKWIESTRELSKGKAEGNLRSMHGNTAAGIFTQIAFNDAENAVDAIAHVVDDNEWEKCLKGVYTGFSIGGSYGNKWQDGDMLRYTAIPIEGSLVDRPCIPTATFYEIQKADGVLEKREWDVEKIAPREDVKPSEGKGKYGDVTFADEKNKKYPIDTESHIRAAWNYINKPKNAGFYSAKDFETIKSKIVAAWKKKIDKEGPPSAQKGEGMDKQEAISELEKYFGGEGKEIRDATQAIYALGNISELLMSEMMEGHEESPQQTALLQSAIDSIKAFIVSELAEKAEKLEKAGREFSTANITKIQAIHDHAASMGASCKAEDASKIEKEDMGKMAGIKEKIGKLMEEAEGMEDMDDVKKELKSVMKLDDEEKAGEVYDKAKKGAKKMDNAEKDEKIAFLEKSLDAVTERLAKLEAQPINKGHSGRMDDGRFDKQEDESDPLVALRKAQSAPNYGDPRISA